MTRQTAINAVYAALYRLDTWNATLTGFPTPAEQESKDIADAAYPALAWLLDQMEM